VALGAQSVRNAFALSVAVASTVIGPVTSGEDQPGSLPSVVYRMTAPGVAVVTVTTCAAA
jgi:hypothetical protein